LAKALPSSGGGTHFIDTMAVLDAMPENLRAKIAGRRAVHKYLSRRNVAKVAIRTPEEEAQTPDVSHPLIRTISETGRQALYINPNRIDHIEGLDNAQSDALLDEVYAFAFEERFQHRHDWQLGDLVMWDNACTMHRAGTDFDVTELREFHRVLLQGRVPQ
jgi:taurine dioxygenase